MKYSILIFVIIVGLAGCYRDGSRRAAFSDGTCTPGYIIHYQGAKSAHSLRERDRHCEAFREAYAGQSCQYRYIDPWGFERTERLYWSDTFEFCF